MMKAISLWQPWASLLAVGAKRYETRSWAPPSTIEQGDLIAIHAGKSRQGMRIAQQSYRLGTMCDLLLGSGHTDRGDWQEDLPFGRVIAVVRLVGSRTTTLRQECELISDQEIALGDWSDGRWAWQLDLVLRLDEPLPQQGRQGLFEIDWDSQAGIYTQAIARGIDLDAPWIPGCDGDDMQPTTMACNQPLYDVDPQCGIGLDPDDASVEGVMKDEMQEEAAF